MADKINDDFLIPFATRIYPGAITLPSSKELEEDDNISLGIPNFTPAPTATPTPTPTSTPTPFSQSNPLFPPALNRGFADHTPHEFSTRPSTLFEAVDKATDEIIEQMRMAQMEQDPYGSGL
jgi:hypothetical protein